METKLQAEKRDETGKGVARRLRADGRVPGVLYGQGVEPVALSVDAREMFHILHGAAGGERPRRPRGRRVRAPGAGP